MTVAFMRRVEIFLLTYLLIRGLGAEPKKLISFGCLTASDASNFVLSRFRAFVSVGTQSSEVK